VFYILISHRISQALAARSGSSPELRFRADGFALDRGIGGFPMVINDLFCPRHCGIRSCLSTGAALSWCADKDISPACGIVRFQNNGFANMGKKPIERLDPKLSTVKKLFAYSGNQCAIPDCTEQLVDASGAMLGKIAHIRAAEKGGARFDPAMTNEERRAFDNLFLVCGKHHDIIDYGPNVKANAPSELRKYKADHEDRFKRAERQLIEQVTDSTQAALPTYPKTLKRLRNLFDITDYMDVDEEVVGLSKFIDSLKELPLDQREFAIKLAQRMKRQGNDDLPADDVVEAFNLSLEKLKYHMELLEHHGLGEITEGLGYQKYIVRLWDRDPGGNPWVEILEFCEETDSSTSSFIYDLNFAQYDA
jgi:hypothetical protein